MVYHIMVAPMAITEGIPAPDGTETAAMTLLGVRTPTCPRAFASARAGMFQSWFLTSNGEMGDLDKTQPRHNQERTCKV